MLLAKQNQNLAGKQPAISPVRCCALAAGFRKFGYLPNEVVVDAYQQTSEKMCKGNLQVL